MDKTSVSQNALYVGRGEESVLSETEDFFDEKEIDLEKEGIHIYERNKNRKFTRCPDFL